MDTKTAAASELPPPRPASIGMPLSTLILKKLVRSVFPLKHANAL